MYRRSHGDGGEPRTVTHVKPGSRKAGSSSTATARNHSYRQGPRCPQGTKAWVDTPVEEDVDAEGREAGTGAPRDEAVEECDRLIPKQAGGSEAGNLRQGTIPAHGRRRTNPGAATREGRRRGGHQREVSGRRRGTRGRQECGGCCLACRGTLGTRDPLLSWGEGSLLPHGETGTRGGARRTASSKATKGGGCQRATSDRSLRLAVHLLPTYARGSKSSAKVCSMTWGARRCRRACRWRTACRWRGPGRGLASGGRRGRERQQKLARIRRSEGRRSLW